MAAGHTSKAKPHFQLTNKIQLGKNHKNSHFLGNYEIFFLVGGVGGRISNAGKKIREFFVKLIFWYSSIEAQPWWQCMMENWVDSRNPWYSPLLGNTHMGYLPLKFSQFLITVLIKMQLQVQICYLFFRKSIGNAWLKLGYNIRHLKILFLKAFLCLISISLVADFQVLFFLLPFWGKICIYISEVTKGGSFQGFSMWPRARLDESLAPLVLPNLSHQVQITGFSLSRSRD